MLLTPAELVTHKLNNIHCYACCISNYDFSALPSTFTLQSIFYCITLHMQSFLFKALQERTKEIDGTMVRIYANNGCEVEFNGCSPTL